MLVLATGSTASAETRRERRARVLSVAFAVAGGILSLATALVMIAGKGMAGAEGSGDLPTPWPASDQVYVWGYVLVGVVILAAGWVLSRRPGTGAIIALVALAVLFADVALFPLTTFDAHVFFWVAIAVPVMIASSIGLWRVRVQGRSAGHRDGQA